MVADLVNRLAPVALGALSVGLLLAAMAASRRWRVCDEESSRAYLRGAEGPESRRRSALEGLSEGSGAHLSAGELLTVWGACCALPPLACLSLGLSAPVALVAMVVGAAAPALWLRRLRKRARSRFSEDLGHALPLVATNLRGGLSVKQSLAPVASNLDEPIRGEFELLARNMERGMPVEEALMLMAERNDNRDLVLLASAVATQTETGGNLADIVDNVAATIRARTELRRSIKSKTSQQQGTALFLLLFPIAIFAAVCALSPTYRDFYATPSGLLVIVVCAVLEAIGFIAVRRMTNLKID